MNLKQIIKEEIRKILNEEEMNNVLLSIRTLLSKYSSDMSEKSKNKLFYHLRRTIFQNYQEDFIDVVIDYIMQNLDEYDAWILYHNCEFLSRSRDGLETTLESDSIDNERINYIINRMARSL